MSKNNINILDLGSGEGTHMHKILERVNKNWNLISIDYSRDAINLATDYTENNICIIGDINNFTYPCGICRQFLFEFAPDLWVITGENEEITSEWTYILNTGTKKFHLLTCSGAPSTTSKNYKLTDKTRSQVIYEGYSPCSICKP